jgi:hypothetical protein
MVYPKSRLYDKYAYWVTRGLENIIERMNEMLEQRNELAPEEARSGDGKS